MKGLVRIGGALGVGFVIILAALVVNDASSIAPEGAVVVSKAPERNYINAQDSDSDGVKDWEENLQGKVFDTIDTPTSTAYTVPTPEEYEPPTTFTGKFSEAFFQDYLQGKINGEDFSDPTKFVGNAVTAIEQNTKSKTHTRLELSVITSSEKIIKDYGNELAHIIQKQTPGSENEAIILQKALTGENPEKLKELDPIYNTYVQIISELLLLPIPDTLADKHVALINAAEAVLTDIEAFRLAFEDPLYALARVEKYQDDAQTIHDSLKSIIEIITSHNVSYLNSEPGAVLYLFNS